MKSIAKFLIGLTMAAVLLIGYYLISSKLPMEMTVNIVPAAFRQEDFDIIKDEIATGKYGGIYSLEDINNYAFVTISLHADNFSPFTAEWTQFTPKTLDGDLLIYQSDSGPKDIKSFNSDDFTVTLFTSNRYIERSGWLEYYIFGRFHSIQVSAIAE